MRFNRFSLLLIGCALAQLVDAHEFEAGELHIAHPWSRAMPPAVPTGAAYLEISNHGAENDTLLGADSPAADKVEIHEHVHADGLMKMQQVDSLVIAPGETVTFQPGAYHLMLFNLKQPLSAGEHFPLTLHFAVAGDVDVVVNVQAADEPATHDAGSGHAHH
ncbi:copper chaperone PCu(A)C [Halopseudomonas oceani]|uniref:copper chaperone PCu(A)C n=1 Tax=Halopseudomonas oceani TaxID=1708783 RepID=UPI002AA82310|nr:copper chaperone PCu(A)C [Halopseudomonas oceani]